MMGMHMGLMSIVWVLIVVLLVVLIVWIVKKIGMRGGDSKEKK